MRWPKIQNVPRYKDMIALLLVFRKDVPVTRAILSRKLTSEVPRGAGERLYLVSSGKLFHLSLSLSRSWLLHVINRC